MKILLINGSPKGNYNCTLQAALYLEKKFPAHSFTYLNIGAQNNRLECDFAEAETLLFAYPVYTFIAPSQLHRFIALIANPKLKNKLGNKLNEGMIAPYKNVLEKSEGLWEAVKSLVLGSLLNYNPYKMDYKENTYAGRHYFIHNAIFNQGYRFYCRRYYFCHCAFCLHTARQAVLFNH